MRDLLHGLLLLGVLWGAGHAALEAVAGAGLHKPGVPLTVGLALLLVLAWRERNWALAAGVVLTAVGTYYVAVAHFVPDRNTTWFGPLPWLLTADVAEGAWSVVYRLLIEAGLLIGLAIVW